MILYVIGPSNSGKSKYIHKMIKERLSSTKQVMIVPEQYTLQAEIELIRDLESKGIIDVEVMSFNRFCTHVISETGSLKETEINKLGKAMVLRSILDKHADELLVYSQVSKKTGFIEKLTTLLSEMKHVGIDGNVLRKRLEDAGTQTLIDRKLFDVATILDYYNDFMSGEYFDEEDKLLAVIDRLKASGILEETVVYFDGFDSFSNQEYQLMTEMMKLAKGSVFSLSMADSDVYAPVNRTFKKIRKIADIHGIKEHKHLIEDSPVNKELYHLKSNFFSFPYEVYKEENDHVSLHMNNNMYDEIEGVCRDIIDKIRSGYRYKDLSVVTGHLEGYTSIVKRIFGEYKIPYFIDDKVSIMNHPIIRFILSSLRAVNSGFKKEDVLRLMKSGFCDIESEAVYHFENYIVSHGLRGKKWLDPIEDEDLDETRKKVVEPLFSLLESMPKKAPISDMTKVLYKYLMDSNIPEKTEKWIDYLKEEQAFSKVQESAQVWNVVVEIFDQLIELEGDDIKTIKDYIRILEAGFTEVTLGLIPPSIDQVVINSVERSKAKGVKGIYVVGLNDGMLPKKYSDEGLLLDDEKLHLKDAGIDLETDADSILSRDMFSTYTALLKASDFIRFSFSLSDVEGKALRPSIYVDKLERIFDHLKPISHVLDIKEPDQVYNKSNHYKSLTEQLRIYADDYDIDEKWFSALYWYEKQDEWKAKVDKLPDALFYDNQVESIDKSHAKELYKLPLLSSVSRLERYSRCPFSHFIHYGLRPKQRKEYEIDLPDIGSLFHKSLEKFDGKMKTYKEDWMTIDKARTYELMDEIVDELVVNFKYDIFSSSSRIKYMIKKLKRVGKRAVWTLVTQVKQGDFLPYAHEVGFSASGYNTVPPIIIELSSGDRMMLEGQIDRVDMYEENGKNYIKIIDYKSGSKKFSLSEVYQGLQLQLMVYLDAILENSQYFKVDELYPAGVFYFKIDDPILESEILKGDMTEEEILKSLKMDGLLVENINIAKAMDNQVIDKRKSSVIPFELKKDDSISSRSKVAKAEEFYMLIDHVKSIVKDIGDEITGGRTLIEPIKLGTMTGCMSCDYKNVCQFDQGFGNRYKNLSNMKDDEVLECIKKGGDDAKLDA
ncbi:helicase-exonuclease AddAB subunit AddB [Acidaminobacter sp. JC074]|uniref:helicase-exonuclease AddAB subunit AddB n=1 Tax=Acidaminobacter sp. JC074 TaxID=2530199 RepID=UPI001F0E3BE1|nr:helicase-exonuclease AddAB subunit AddB [Acidaminobacter sp. JC074]MCH4889197.1 helicase-exonuclease AddAB subunit AddB [Acidaminobacter sp. JC074]